MKQLNKLRDLLPVPSFSVIIICFFFPFIVVNCGGKSILSISGTQLVTGSKIDASKINKDKLMNSFLGDETSALLNKNTDTKANDENVKDNEEAPADNSTAEETADPLMPKMDMSKKI